MLAIVCRYIGTDNNIVRNKNRLKMKSVLFPSLINGSKTQGPIPCIAIDINPFIVGLFINLISRSKVQTALVNIGKNLCSLFFYCPLR